MAFPATPALASGQFLRSVVSYLRPLCWANAALGVSSVVALSHSTSLVSARPLWYSAVLALGRFLIDHHGTRR
jgi:hypothetical protein